MVKWVERVESVEVGSVTPYDDGYGGKYTYSIIVNGIERPSKISYSTKHVAKQRMCRAVEDMRVLNGVV